MKVEREIKAALLNRSGVYPIVTVVGPRQSGKTTMVKGAFPEHDYVSLEDFDNRDFAREDPRGFLNQHSNGVILDEIQRVPELLSYIQTAVDVDDAPGRFILTGSNQFSLMKGVPQSLAGRTSILKLLPFSYSELKDTVYAPSDRPGLLYTGGYPRIYDKQLESREWHSSYLETYFEKDLKDLMNVSDLNAFRKLLILLASSCGQLLNLSKLGNSIGVSHTTVKTWIAALEASFLIYLLQPYHKNYKRRIVKSPKIYFYDTGLVCTLLRIQSSEQLADHYVYGSLFENWVVSEYLKYCHNSGSTPSSFFWRDHTGNEVDLVIETARGPFPVEIKSAQTIASDFFKNLTLFTELASLANPIPALVYGGDDGQKRTSATVVPWKELPELWQNIESI